MKRRDIRALITGAGSGYSGNLIRALRSMTPRPYITGVNDDRFVLKQSLADQSYLCPSPSGAEFIASILEIIARENINVVLPTDDNIVKAFSDARDQFSIELMLPHRETIELCQDKYELTIRLRERGVPAPLTYEVRTLRDLDGIFAQFPQADTLWCRTRRGSRSMGAAPVANARQARAWITQWRDLRGVKVSNFTLAEYLPGRHFMVQCVWHKGDLLRVQPIEVLSYFAAGNNPSGVFSLANLAKTVAAPHAVKTTLDAVRAVEQHPSGTYFVELRETSDGVPAITEINAGRFPSGVTSLLAIGDDNMVAAFASAAVDNPVAVADPLGAPQEHYLVRDIDTIPGVFSAADILGR
jgi:hypothetical protein